MIEWLKSDMLAPEIALAGRVLPIELNRHPRARRLTLRLAPDGSAVKITLPKWCRSAEAIAFVHARSAWLEAQLGKIPQAEDPVARGSLRYRGEALPFAWSAKAPRKPSLAEGVLQVGGPQDGLAGRLQRWLETEAKRLMTADLAFYCKHAGLTAPELRLTRAKRRWGSCSTKGVVRVNWRLVQAPDPVRRSVVAHETAHLVHFDHSPAFHGLLGEIYEGDIAEADLWLREHGRTLYSDFG